MNQSRISSAVSPNNEVRASSTQLHQQCGTKHKRCGRNALTCAGRFGFQKEMNALQSLSTGNEEEAFNVTALLRSTHEVETRVQEIYRCLPSCG